MSDPKHLIENLPQPTQELTPEQAAAVCGGASDYLLVFEGIKGESKSATPPRFSANITKVGTGTPV